MSNEPTKLGSTHWIEWKKRKNRESLVLTWREWSCWGKSCRTYCLAICYRTWLYVWKGALFRQWKCWKGPYERWPYLPWWTRPPSHCTGRAGRQGCPYLLAGGKSKGVNLILFFSRHRSMEAVQSLRVKRQAEREWKGKSATNQIELNDSVVDGRQLWDMSAPTLANGHWLIRQYRPTEKKTIHPTTTT